MSFSEDHVSSRDLEYYPVRARGRFLYDKEIYFYAPDQNFGAGYHLYTPFQIKNSKKILVVNRGFIPEQIKDPRPRHRWPTT